jgi:hypothetical protein
MVPKPYLVESWSGMWKKTKSVVPMLIQLRVVSLRTSGVGPAAARWRFFGISQPQENNKTTPQSPFSEFIVDLNLLSKQLYIYSTGQISALTTS